MNFFINSNTAAKNSLKKRVGYSGHALSSNPQESVRDLHTGSKTEEFQVFISLRMNLLEEKCQEKNDSSK